MAYETQAWAPRRIITRTAEQEGEPVERRHHPKLKIELPGRYLTPDGEEYECMTVDFSLGGVRFRAPVSPSPGANVIAYVSELGRLQGSVMRRMSDGFVIALALTELKTERLAHKIARLNTKDAKDRRLFPRVALAGALIPVRCADGRNELAPVIDVSESGIAFRTSLALQVGERLEIGEQTGVIVRMFDGGAAAKFA